MSYLQTGAEKLHNASADLQRRIQNLHQRWRDAIEAENVSEAYAAAMSLRLRLTDEAGFDDEELKLFLPFRPHVKGSLVG